jgi:hypothetical protein
MMGLKRWSDELGDRVDHLGEDLAESQIVVQMPFEQISNSRVFTCSRTCSEPVQKKLETFG